MLQKIQTKSNETYEGTLIQMDKYMNTVLEDVLVTQHSVFHPETGEKFVLNFQQVYLKGISIKNIILPKDCIEKYKSQQVARKLSEAESSQLCQDSQEESSKNEEIEMQQTQKKEKSYGRGQKRAAENILNDQKEPQTEVSHQGFNQDLFQNKNQLQIAQGRGRGRGQAYGRGQRPKPEEQNPSLTSSEKDEIIDALLQMSQQIRMNSLTIEKLQSRRGTNTRRKQKQKMLIPNQISAIKKPINESQENLDQNQTQLADKKVSAFKVGDKIRYDDLQALMDTPTDEFLQRIEEQQLEIRTKNQELPTSQLTNQTASHLSIV
eukprot:403350744